MTMSWCLHFTWGILRREQNYFTCLTQGWMFFFNLSSLVWASVSLRHFEICLSENPISFAFLRVSSVTDSLGLNEKERFKFKPSTIKSSNVFNFKNTKASLFPIFNVFRSFIFQKYTSKPLKPLWNLLFAMLASNMQIPILHLLISWKMDSAFTVQMNFFF